MGRKRLPASVHVLKGTFQPCRHGEKDAPPMLPHATLEPPEWLSHLAKAEWIRVVKVLEPAKVLTEGDVALLITYCGLFAEQQWLLTNQLPLDGPKSAQLRLCASELGLTPSSRAKLGTARGKKENPFGEFGQPERPGPPVRRTG